MTARQSTKNTTPTVVDLPYLFGKVHAGEAVSERDVTSAESVSTKASIVAALAIYLRIVVLDSNPGRYAKATGRQLAYVQRAHRIGADLARVGDKVTTAQALASSWLRNAKATEAVSAFDAIMTRANDGEPVTPGIVGPAYGRLLTTAQALAQADAKAAKVTETEGAGEGSGEGSGEPAETAPERTDEQRGDDALKILRPVLRRAAEGDVDAMAVIAKIGKACQVAAKAHAKHAPAQVETETEPTEVAAA